MVKTSKVTPAEFSAKFGTPATPPESFSYFLCDNGIGVVRNDTNQTLEIMAAAEINPLDISFEDELQLLSLICGDYKEHVSIPRTDTFLDYQERENVTRRQSAAVWIAFSLFVLVCSSVVMYLYIL